jgi:class 3 adenylate cyclase
VCRVDGHIVSATPQERPAESIPTGTVTFVFAEIEGSIGRRERDRASMEAAVRRHDELARTAIEAHNGYVFKTIGSPSAPRSRGRRMPFPRPRPNCRSGK